MSMPFLTPLQQKFVEAFVCSPDATIRLHAAAAYTAAGGKVTTQASAEAAASRMLHYVNVQTAIAALQRQADAQIIAQLVDWKRAAVELQPLLIALTRGILPDGRRMATRDDAAIAQAVLASMREILDRGFPKGLKISVDPKDALAVILGVPRETLPDTPDEMG